MLRFGVLMSNLIQTALYNQASVFRMIFKNLHMVGNYIAEAELIVVIFWVKTLIVREPLDPFSSCSMSTDLLLQGSRQALKQEEVQSYHFGQQTSK